MEMCTIIDKPIINGSYTDELWMPITDYMVKDVVNGYFISTYSRVYSKNRNIIMQTYPTSNVDCHQNIYLRLNSGNRIKIKVYRLTMLAFNYIPRCENYYVNHIDGNPLNNHISNLQWCTSSYNRLHAIRNNLADYVIGENNKNSTITDQEVINIIKYYLNNPACNNVEIANIFGHYSYISDIVNGNTRFMLIEKYITDTYGLVFSDSIVHKICRCICKVQSIYKHKLMPALKSEGIFIKEHTPEYLTMRLIAHKRFEAYRKIYTQYDF